MLEYCIKVYMILRYSKVGPPPPWCQQQELSFNGDVLQCIVNISVIKYRKDEIQTMMDLLVALIIINVIMQNTIVLVLAAVKKISHMEQ